MSAVIYLGSDVKSRHGNTWADRLEIVEAVSVIAESVELPTGPPANGTFQVLAEDKSRARDVDTSSNGFYWCTRTITERNAPSTNVIVNVHKIRGPTGRSWS